MRESQTEIGVVRWLIVLNDSEENIPPYALLEVTGVDDDGAIVVNKPVKNGCQNCLVCGPISILPGQKGQAHNTFPAAILYDDTDDPELDQEWGSREGSWMAHLGEKGFIIISSGSDGLVNVTRRHKENVWVRIPEGNIPDAEGYYDAVVEEWNEVTEDWVQVGTCLFRDANS